MKKNILILCGGRSGEHEISLKSASSVIAHLNKSKYNVAAVCITKDGVWLKPQESAAYLAESVHVSPVLLNSKTKKKFDITQQLAAQKEYGSLSGIDVVFPVLHGPYGEDGTVQGFLELLEVPFVGSDTLASAMAMDKDVTKRLYVSAGIPTPQFWLLTKKNRTSVSKKIDLPCVVKPMNLGSSVGVAIVKQKKDFADAIDKAFAMDRKGEVLVEKYIHGRELTVPVLGNRVLPVIEIIPRDKNRWFDYEVKYDPDLVEEVCPAKIPPRIARKAQQYGLMAHHALKCRHISRTDMIWQTDTDIVYVLETNTLPGMTSASLFPKAAKAIGMSYSVLLDTLISMALREKSVLPRFLRA